MHVIIMIKIAIATSYQLSNLYYVTMINWRQKLIVITVMLEEDGWWCTGEEMDLSALTEPG